MKIRPVLGVIACDRTVNGEAAQSVMLRYLKASLSFADCSALIVPSLPDLVSAEDIAQRLDGLLLTGSPSNVQPARYGEDQAGEGPFDPGRDEMTARLVRAMIARRRPVFGICRGLQELNVILGGTLRRDLSAPGAALPHHAPDGSGLDEMFAHTHAVDLVEDGVLARVLGSNSLQVNSVHYQGIGRLAPGLRAEALAADGLVEAVSGEILGAPVVAVQWHPEWNTEATPHAQAFFRMLGRSLRGKRLEPSNAKAGHDIAQLRRQDLAHHLPCFQDYKLMETLGGARIITHAKDSTIHDGDGNAILDGMAGLWCVQVGYGREELAEVAYRQIVELSYYNNFFRTATPPTIQLAAKIASLLGGDLRYVFFSNSGSEANDTVVRMARYYWDLKGKSTKKTIIGRDNAYHGSTVAGASLGGMKYMHVQGDLPIPGVARIMQPYTFEEGYGEDADAFAERAAQALEDKILELGADTVAAFIGEPVQGAGGVIIPPKGYWPRIEAICRKYDVLLVMDEVITGYGRLGTWFGHHHFGVKPDMVSMAKGLSSGYQPISATAVSSHIIETLKSVREDFSHGYTYSGHPVAAAVALRNIEIIEREGLVERTANETAPAFARMLAKIGKHPLVGEARSIGLMGAVEIVAEPGTNKRFEGPAGAAATLVRDECIARGLMVRAVRESIIMCPPLVITLEEISTMGQVIAAALDAAAARLTLTKEAVS